MMWRALTWDSLRIVQQAIQDCGKLTGDVEKDRQCVRDALAKIKEFDGITGKMTFTEEGDPDQVRRDRQDQRQGRVRVLQVGLPVSGLRTLPILRRSGEVLGDAGRLHRRPGRARAIRPGPPSEPIEERDR